MCRFGLLACCACRVLAEAGERACLAPPPNTAASATACRFLLRVAESPPARLLASPPQSRPSARLCLPSLLPLAPKHQRQNTEPALHSNATQGNQNPAAKQD